MFTRPQFLGGLLLVGLLIKYVNITKTKNQQRSTKYGATEFRKPAGRWTDGRNINLPEYKPRFPKPGPRRKPSRRPTGPAEQTIQAGVEHYLNIHKIRFIHLPDCVLRLCSPISKIPLWHKREISQALKGIPDIIAFIDNRVLLLELKRKGGRLRQPQRAWLKGLKHHVADTLVEAIAIINDFRNE